VVPGSAQPREPERNSLRQLLQQSSSWVYQLQDARQADLSRTHYDVAVIDAFFGGDQKAMDELRRKPLGGRRILLSYLSIGEAEVYRYYWAQCCKGHRRPDWVLSENKQWRGNFRVRFWHPEWKAIIYESADSYLKRIVDAGFDGVYLDRIDVYSEVSEQGVDPRAEMVRFVRALAAKSRAMKPDFLVIAQNAEELLDDRGYLATIDGIAKEDLLFGVGGDGRRNETSMIGQSTARLKRALEAGKQVMVVEYLKDPRTIAATRTELQELGFVPYFAPRNLERLQVENLEEEDSH
jgi:cysteinyl-tRNA synthetase